jgi:hypothetical protein
MARTRHPFGPGASFIRLPVFLTKYSGRRRLCWLLAAFGMVAGRLLLLPTLSLPEPRIHDEFSHLLAADTYARGRVVNPPLEPAEAFESTYILVSPIYASKYPPGQGLLLAFGQKVLGHPYWAVVIAGALMVYLFCWAADAWLPPQWTLVAAALASGLYFVRHYWFMSYWGGTLAACGGALVVGGLGRILRGKEKGTRASLGGGAIILYLARPDTGAVLCLAVGGILVVHMLRMPSRARLSLMRRTLAPNVALMAAAVPPVLAFNLAATGTYTDLPYTMHARQYHSVPELWLLPAREDPPHLTPKMKRMTRMRRGVYETRHGQPLTTILKYQGAYMAVYYVGRPLVGFGLLLLAAPWTRVRNGRHWLLFLMAAGVTTVTFYTWVLEHYLAPFAAVQLILIIGAARALWSRALFVPWGRRAVAGAMIFLLVFLAADYVRAARNRPTARAEFVRKLESLPGPHLVFVTYDPGWSVHDEWVYNGAELDESPLIFANWGSPDQNQRVLERYPGRRVWSLQLGPDRRDILLSPYHVSPGDAVE